MQEIVCNSRPPRLDSFRRPDNLIRLHLERNLTFTDLGESSLTFTDLGESSLTFTDLGESS